jgi:hypothetical protein
MSATEAIMQTKDHPRCLKVSIGAVSALPPDVRRWLCPAVELPFTFLGYALDAAFGPMNLKG